ncbi:MAG: methyltransferase domain-containing protein [Candidatus Colwellbacteria bacterium]|nr:methyltransferase domain-containing protein [Candidatus Colwellbacteria bacterium]
MKISLDKKTIESINRILETISSNHEVEFRLGSLQPGKFVSGVDKHIFSNLLQRFLGKSKDSSSGSPAYRKVESKVTYYRDSDVRKIEEDGKTSFQYKKKDSDVDITFTTMDVRLSTAVEKDAEPVVGGTVSATRIREKNIFSFNGFDIELSRVKNSFLPGAKNISGDTYEVEAEFTKRIAKIEEFIVPLRIILDILYPERFYMIPREDEKAIRFLRERINTTVYKPKNIKRKDIPHMKEYSVTNKLNGVGYEMFISEKGIYIINSTNIDKLTSKVIPEFMNTIIEGEWYKGEFHIFNCLAFKGHDVSRRPHPERLGMIRDLVPLIQDTLKDVCPVEVKTFLYTKNPANDTREIMRYIYNRYGKDALESNDGIMYTPMVGIPLKFKFPSTMTIDFEITDEKISPDRKIYTIRVYTRNNNELVPFDGRYKYRTGETSNIKVNPKMVVEKGSPLFDQLSNGLIVECLYNKEKNYFIPERVRWDKKLPNFIEVALDVFKDIIHPIKLEDLVSMFEKEITVDEESKGEEEKSSDRPWRVYFNFGKRGDKVFSPPSIEMAGGFEILDGTEDVDDILQLFPPSVRSEVLWIEKTGDDKMIIALRPSGADYIMENSKMKTMFRSLSSKVGTKSKTPPSIAESSKKSPGKKGDCLIPMRKFNNTKKNELIAKYANDAVVLDLGFGRGGDLLKYSNAKTKYVFGVEPNDENLDEAKSRYADKKNNYKVKVKFINCKAQDTATINEAMDYKKVDVVASFFSLTFFFEQDKELTSLINTIAGNTKIGGYFIGTTMSGDETYKMLKGKSKIDYPGCYKIDKRYEDDDKEELGKKIVIHLEETIVTEQVEYLVFFDIFKKRMASRGFILVESEFFDPPKILNKQTYDLSKLNMTFVFQRIETPEEARVRERAASEKERLKSEEDNSLEMVAMDKSFGFKVPYLSTSLVRTGTVGDGSCFFHAVLKSISPDYSKLDRDERKEFVAKLRNKLADQLTMKQWESFGNGTLAYSRVIPRVVKYIKSNVPSIFDIAKGVENSRDSSTVQNYLDQLIILVPDDLVKKVTNIFSQLRKKIFEEFKVDLTKCSTWVGQEMGSVDVFEYISDYLNIDIYLIKDTTRAPYRQGVDCNIRYKDRKSVIVLWIGDSHYEAAGILEGKKIKRVFEPSDEIIKTTKAYVCPE